MSEYFVRGGEIILPAVDFDPPLIFDCGQAFRFTPNADGVGPNAENVWSGVAFGKPLSVLRRGDEVSLSCTEDDYISVWRHYFDMESDYAAARARISSDDFTRSAAEFGAGIRILNQDFWEALCTFIISQNNNIRNIRSTVEKLCALCGEPIGERYTFPTAERIASLKADDLASIRSGYRARYIVSAARQVAEGRITPDELLPLSTDAAIKRLCELEGVGKKVASCVLLFGAGKRDAFPIDVWMKRALETYYPANFDPTAAFGADAGIAQQYIFHYTRHLAEKV